MARTRLGFALAVAFWLAGPLSHAAIAPPLPQPAWKELNAEQQRVLAPLSGEWDKMEGFRRKKWLGIAQRYPSLTPDEQARVQRRMTAWAKLTPEERKRARDQYKSLKTAPPEQKQVVKQKWEEYKELPESEKARLKAEAAKKPAPRPPPAKAAIAPAPATAAGNQPPSKPSPPPTVR